MAVCVGHHRKMYSCFIIKTKNYYFSQLSGSLLHMQFCESDFSVTCCQIVCVPWHIEIPAGYYQFFNDYGKLQKAGAQNEGTFFS